jgi:hypothetical protein
LKEHTINITVYNKNPVYAVITIDVYLMLWINSSSIFSFENATNRADEKRIIYKIRVAYWLLF